MTIVNASYDSNITLTAEEMLAVSQEISLKFSPDKKATDLIIPDLRAHYYKTNASSANNSLFSLYKLDQCYCPEELYEISNDISRHFAPKLPITVPEIFLLPVDPYHLYAYWQANPSTALKNPSEERLVVRVFWRPDAGRDNKTPKVWFGIEPGQHQSKQKIRLPICNTSYSAALGKLDAKNQFTELCHSNIIHVPPAPQIGRSILPPRPSTNVEQNPEVLDDLATNIDLETPAKPSPAQAQQTIGQDWSAILHNGKNAIDLGVITNIDSLLATLSHHPEISLEMLDGRPSFEPQQSNGGNASGRGL